MAKHNSNKLAPIAYIVSMHAGLEAFIYREVDALYERGYSITLFATKFAANDVYSPKPNWPYYTAPIWRLLIELPYLLLKMLTEPKLLLEAIKDNGIVDLIFATKYAPIIKKIGACQIHCHFGDHKLFVGYYCKRLTGLPLSVTIHSHELHVNPNEKLFEKVIIDCTRIFAISKLAVDILVNRYSVPAERVFLNKLSLDLDIWSDKKPVRVLTVGRFQPQKGFKYLFGAAQLLQNENVEFIVVGFGPINVRLMAKKMGVDDKVVFFDKLDQPQLRLMYQNCDIYCLPSITHPEQGKEGIPVVLMEAMACGLPIVATNAGAVSELVEDTLVAEQSSRDLADAIRTLINNPDLRHKQGIHNRSIVSKKHNLNNIDDFAAMLTAVQKR